MLYILTIVKSSQNRSNPDPLTAVATAVFPINTDVPTFRRLVDVVGTAKDTSDHHQKMFEGNTILQLVKDTYAKLKSLSDFDRDSVVNPCKKIEDAKIPKDFQFALQGFQKVQQLGSQCESSYTPSLLSSSLPLLAIDPFYRFTFSYGAEEADKQVVLLGNEIAFNEAIIDEREPGTRDIEVQIGQSNEIFKDLAVEQGVVIDEIQSNIVSSAGATIEDKSSVLVVLVIFVFALVIFLIIFII
ncbi:hypothetical protein UlMin_044026 [Ulmus minor]